MPRLKPKTEKKKTKGVVSNVEHLEEISKAGRLLYAIKQDQGKQITIPITSNTSIEVSAKLTKKEIKAKVIRYVDTKNIDHSKLHPMTKSILGVNKEMEVEVC